MEWHSILNKLDGLMGVQLNHDVDAMTEFVKHYFEVTLLADMWDVSPFYGDGNVIRIQAKGNSYDVRTFIHPQNANHSARFVSVEYIQDSKEFGSAYELLALLRRYYPSNKDDIFFSRDEYFNRVIVADLDALKNTPEHKR